MKRSVVNYQQRLGNIYGYTDGISYKQVCMVHDEIQVTSPLEIAHNVGAHIARAITDAGVDFKSRCPLEGKYKIGINWKETH